MIAAYPPSADAALEEDAPILKRATDVVSFVEMVKAITDEGRETTDEERTHMAGWMGWGGMAPAFERYPKSHWQEVAAQLTLLLGEQGKKEASAATPTSFFTPAPLARLLWDIARDLGFTGGRVLEPGCGSGNILAAAPSDLSLSLLGVEREPFSAQVARLRLPNAAIRISPLEKTVLVNGTYDLVIGNVPFSSVPVYDREMRGASLVLHNYFLYRALRALHPGGLAVLLTSRYTLDANRESQRNTLHKLGVLLGALRLPSGAFSDAKTEVITDILVFQRRHPAVMWQGQPWQATRRDIVEGVDINEYYGVCPDHIIGTPRVDHGMYRGDELRIAPPDDLAASLDAARASLAAATLAHDAGFLPIDDHTTLALPHQPREDGKREGSFHLVDGKLVHVIESALVEVLRYVPELTALVELKYAALALLEAERDLDRPDSELAPLRARLNACYDAYVQKFGAIHRATLTYGQPDKETGEMTINRRRPSAMLAFRDDPDYYAVLGLETYDDESQEARKAEIFERRIFVRPVRKTYAETPAEALSLCLDECGRLDLPTIARLLSVTIEKAAAALGDLVYEDTECVGCWVTREEYLSGNVRKKLAEARRLVALDSRYERNVAALEAVQPEDLAPEEIHAQLGAGWIPVEVIEQFCKELFQVDYLTIRYEKMTGTWELTINRYTRSMAAITEWGTPRANGFELVEAAMNHRVPIVYDKVDDRQVRNVDETLMAQEKLRAICDHFSAWVWEDDARAARLAALYNERFNAVVARSYDGSHLTFPAMNPVWEAKLYTWQKDFVWRMISMPSALCGHPVGAGKTTTEIAGAMRMRQLGLISRAAIIVPNHLLEQIAAEAARLYPSARVLLISREDLTKERRKLFVCRVATGDYDLIIMTHSSFQALPVHPETEIKYIEHRAALLRDTLIMIEDDTNYNRRTIKKLETALEKLRQRQRELLDIPRDDGLTIEQLGISYLIIDEAHLFKNLGLPTNMQGLQAPASQRATDLEMKLRWLAEFNRGKPFASFFTATPISNNMVEAFVLAWYLAYASLLEYGLLTVDAFASMFVMTETKVEVSPAGGGFRLHTRPSRFVNMPEFLSLFAYFADLRNPEILDEKRPKRIEKTIVLEPSEAISAYVNSLVARYDELMAGHPRDMGGRDDNALWITGDGRAAALWLGLVGYGPAAPAPKLEAVADNVAEIFKRNQREMKHLDGTYKSLQILFCDLGTPSEERGDQVYGVLRALLIKRGVPKDGIRFVHSAKTGAQKEVLFAQCRRGDVAVLIGSTGKMGTGVNIQTRCAAVHHVDPTWRPDEIEQREGRGHRPGNLYPVVSIYRYVIQRTFDAYFWQTLTRKAVFFHQMRAGKIIGREMDDMGETALSYAQVKAAATGDPLVLEQAELDVEIAQLQRLYSAHARARRREAASAENYRHIAINDHQKHARLLSEMLARMTDKPPVFTTRDGVGLLEPIEICAAIAEQIKKSVFWGGRVLLGFWQSEPLFAVIRESEKKEQVKIEIGGDVYGARHYTDAVLSFESKASWIGKKNQHLYLEVLWEVLANAPNEVRYEEQRAARLLHEADQLETASLMPFARLAELQARQARKKELDTYASLVAASQRDGQDRRAEIDEMRRRLLASAPNWKVTPVHAATEVIVPVLFEVEATPVMPREKQKSTRRKRTAHGAVQQFTFLDESA
jgi:N12 class adenine-specific DNA methylase